MSHPHTTRSCRHRLALACMLALSLGAGGCVLESETPPDISLFDTDLTQGTTQANLWQSRTVEYCFPRPLLSEMPSSVRQRVATQADLDARHQRRKQEFIAAINTTWQAVGVLNLVARDTCGSGMIHVRYNKDTPTGGYAGIGRNGGLQIGIQMDSEFLGERYGWGMNTYHTFVAAHEMGHVLGFRHEQDRRDSTCHESQDFSGTGIALTGYDPNSVMNYCARQVTGLTELDKEGYRRAYQFLTGGTGGGGTGGGTVTNPDPDANPACVDRNQYCDYWATHGECNNYPDYMVANCCASCNDEAPRLVARHAGKCMDVAARGLANGTNIQLYACNGTGAQAFVLRPAGGDTYNIVNVNSGKCVDVDHSGTADGTNIHLWQCNGTNAQRFRLTNVGSGYVRIQNVISNKCVDVSGGSTANGANIHLWTCHNGTNQHWRID